MNLVICSITVIVDPLQPQDVTLHNNTKIAVCKVCTYVHADEMHL